MQLDFSLATEVNQGYLLIPEPEVELMEFRDVYDRICSVIYHCVMVKREPIIKCISTKALEATHIRSALCEFVGIEDLIKQNYPSVDNSDYLLYKSLNPTLHMVKLLRNYNIHISDSRIDKKTMQVQTFLEPGGIFDIDVNYISNLSLSGFRKMKSTKDYSDEQLTRMIDNFDNQQHNFGVTTLIMKAVLDYSKQIVITLRDS